MKGPVPPSILYKFLAPARVGFLRQRRLRFTPPAAFNDPFDCRARATARSGTITSRPAFHLPIGWHPSIDGKEPDWPVCTGVPLNAAASLQSPLLDQEVAEGPPVSLSSGDPRTAWLTDIPDDRDDVLSSSESEALPAALGPMPDVSLEGFALDIPFTPISELSLQEGPKIDFDISRLPGEVVQQVFMVHGGYAKQFALSQLGVLSLSERCDHQLMWSHYADSHRGFAIGLATDHEFLALRDPRNVLVPSTIVIGFDSMFADQQVPPLCKVMYVDRAVSMLRSDPGEIIGTSNHEIFDFAEFLFKSSAWEHEEEWRAFRRLANDAPDDRAKARNIHRREGFGCHREEFVDAAGHPVCTFDVPKAAIAEVLIGLNMSVKDRLGLATALHEDPDLGHVKLRIARSTLDFGIEFDEVEPARLLAGLASEGYLYGEKVLADAREALAGMSPEYIVKLIAANDSGGLRSNIPPALLRQALLEHQASDTAPQ